jgi:dipeptidyl aminopeptidase/acylaminoacyl peptidase
MNKLIKYSLLAACLASASTPVTAAKPILLPIEDETAVYQIDKVHADSPLKFLDVWSRPRFQGIRISPDGNLFAASSVDEKDGRAILAIIDRKTMSVIHTEAFTGGVSVGSYKWHDNDRLIISPTGKSKLFEGRSGYGSFLLNIKTKVLRPVWSGETADYGGGEGASIIEVGENNYYLSVYPSGSNEAEFPFNYLYKLDIEADRATKVLKSPSRNAEFIIKEGKNGKPDEVTHAVGQLPDSYDDVIVHKRVNGKWVEDGKYHRSTGVYVPLRWHDTDPDKMLYVDSRETQTGAYYWVNVKTGARELIYHDPKASIDDVEYTDDDEAWAALTSYDYPIRVPLLPDSDEAIEQKKLSAAFPDYMVDITSETRDRHEAVLVVHNDQDAGKYYIYNRYDGKIRFLLDPRPDVDAKKMPRMHAVHFKARDGMDLVAYLTVPQNKPMKNLPLILLPHGGPHGVEDEWGLNREASTFANAGYAVLQINYRGSGGRGKDFEYKWYRHWGLEMQDDLEDGVLWAAKAGIADINRVCIYGASYGGYASLMGVVKTPDRYKCSIGYVGVYDLETQVKYGDNSRLLAGQRYLREALGTDPKDLAARSSTPNVDRIKAPVFLVEGMMDDRVFPKNYWDMKEALKKKGHRFETLEIPRTGHGAQDLESHREIYCRMIDFFDRHIGPRKPTDKPDDCQFPGDKRLPYEYFPGK